MEEKERVKKESRLKKYMVCHGTESHSLDKAKKCKFCQEVEKEARKMRISMAKKRKDGMHLIWCEKCGGDVFTKGQEVRCEDCGFKKNYE